jgi:hypothetical protein
MTTNFITQRTKDRRAHWLAEIVQLSGQFGSDSTRIAAELASERKTEGSVATLDHLRLAGTIPEHYDHDSSSEKLYSKYTDAVLSGAFGLLGLNSVVLSERGDAADVEATCADFSLVADAKAFRLSRTAKNQKDFKIGALDRWKRGKPFAMVVCPIYQLPHRTSQIYEQAINRTVCIFTYTHLAVLVRLAYATSQQVSLDALHRIFQSTQNLNPDKDAGAYWSELNRTMVAAHAEIPKLWADEKLANIESILAAKEEALTAIAQERQNILSMSHADAIQALVNQRNLDGRSGVIRSVADKGLLDFL